MKIIENQENQWQSKKIYENHKHQCESITSIPNQLKYKGFMKTINKILLYNNIIIITKTYMKIINNT